MGFNWSKRRWWQLLCTSNSDQKCNFHEFLLLGRPCGPLKAAQAGRLGFCRSKHFQMLAVLVPVFAREVLAAYLDS
ncbi:hypothetical protein HanIR_Chr14g0715031 [Helianthus annuus]|nr:hypothetical protein HanIR_Chr14g0715031 [Helianthus annuus]